MTGAAPQYPHNAPEATAKLLTTVQPAAEFSRELEYLRTNGTERGAFKFVHWRDVEQRLSMWKSFMPQAELMYNVSAESDPLLLLRLRDKGVTLCAASASHLELLQILEVPPAQISLTAGASSNNTTRHAADIRPATLTVGGIRALEDLHRRGCTPSAEWQPTLQILVKCGPDEPLINPANLSELLMNARALGFTSLGISVVLSDADGATASFNKAFEAIQLASKSFSNANCTIKSVHILGGLTDSHSLAEEGLSVSEYLSKVSELRDRLTAVVAAEQPDLPVRFSFEAGQLLVGHVPVLSVITNVTARPTSDILEAFFVSTVYGDLAGHMYNKSDISIKVLPPPHEDKPLIGAPVSVVLLDGCCDSVGSVRKVSSPNELKTFHVPSDIRGGCLLAFHGKRLDNGKTDFNAIPPAAFVLIDEDAPEGPFIESPWHDYHAPFFRAAKQFVDSKDGKTVQEVVRSTITSLDSPTKSNKPKLSSDAYYQQEHEQRIARARTAGQEWLSRNASTADTVVLLDLQVYAKALHDVSRRLREWRFEPVDAATGRFTLVQSDEFTVDSIKVPIKTLCDPIALLAHVGAGLDHDAASAEEARLSHLVGVTPRNTVVSHPHKTPATLALMVTPEFQPGATTIDSKEELDRLIQAGLSRDVVLYVRIKARGKDIGTDLSLKFGAQYSESRGIDEVTPLIRLAYHAGFTKLGIAFHVGTQCYDPSSYARSLQHCLAITKKMLDDTPSIKITYFNIGGGFADARVAMKKNTGRRKILGTVSAHVDWFKTAAQSLLGERVHVDAEPGRTGCAEAGTALTRVVEHHSSDSTAMRIRIAMTQQGGLSGNVHDSQYFAAEPLCPNETTLVAPVLIVGNSNRAGEVFPSTRPDQKHLLPVGIKTGDWLMFPEAGAAYGWNAAGAADGIDPGILIAFYTDENGEYHFIESPWSNREALRNAEVRRWYHSRQHESPMNREAPHSD